MGTSAHRLSDLEEAYNVFQATFGGMTHEYNYAATAPTRALRYAAYDIKASRSLQDSLDAYIDTLKPFVIFGSMAGTITNSRGILTLGASIIGIETEDPPLVAHSEWRWDIISLQPVLADYIHALVAYYESEVDSFSSLRAIVSTQREAELVSMSFASFGFDVPVSSIAVSDDAVVWSTFVSSWMGPGTETPFIVAASTANNNSVIQAAASTAAQMGRGVLAIACAIVYSEYAKSSAVFANNSNSDIIFGAFRNNWWTAAAYRGVPANLQQYVPSPRYQLAMQILGVAQQLSSQVYYDYKTTAAEVLYQTAVISASGTAFGPFSNATCTDDEIMANTRDRTCQCAKGIRTIYVHSMRNFQDGVASDRTGRFSWTMTACGVIYSPYEPPLGQRLASLSAGAISGIAVGCAVAFLLVVGALVANSLFFGRNNRAAPKDPSQPFAIVFTDIQSSTSLWARAPAAMSEAVDYHHELMRKALRRNDGYEVKTVGDSFMVAFRDPADAARFALDAQVILHTAEWSSELDAIYLELIAEAEAEETAMNEGGDTSSQSKCLSEVIDPKNYLKVSDATSTSHSFSRSDSIQPVSKGLPERNLPSVVITHNRTRQSSIAFTQNIVAGASTVHMTEHDEECNSVKLWHGLRVRVGLHYGMGDIRKDPTTFGYDYYGTVVNTAARVEGVGHGGQILLTDTAFEALPPGFAKSAKAIIVALGPQPLRGLDAPITLFQMVPSALQGRRFPALRLHVEKETEESSVTETNTATGTSGTDTPEALASRICASKQFMGISPDEILDRYYYFLSTFAPIAGKYQSTIIGKLAESWGFDKASKAVHGGEFGRTRLLVSLMAKVTKTYRAGQKAFAKHHRNTTLSQTHDTMSEAVKSIHRAEIASCTDSRNYNY